MALLDELRERSYTNSFCLHEEAKEYCLLLNLYRVISIGA